MSHHGMLDDFERMGPGSYNPNPGAEEMPGTERQSSQLGEILANAVEKLTGGSSPYYKIFIAKPTDPAREPYWAECNDIIEALKMNFAEGNAFKGTWRHAAHRLGTGKPGSTAIYDSEKIEYFGHRLVEQDKHDQ